MAIHFTEDQEKVITTRDKNILVAAAAGSGKTAVLVERIVQLVTDPDKKVDIDRLLIVTFTSAAASEMRERISDALSRKMEESPEDEHLQRQMTLIHNAQITTIDSFCLFVIRNNFNNIGLDPGFRVADEAELQLLRKDVLAELLEERFAEKDAQFYQCVECYSTNGREKNLEEHILQLYQFAMSYPFPEKWLLQCKKEYAPETLEDLQHSPWMQDILRQVKQLLQDSVEQLQMALQICQEPDGPYMYSPLLEREQEMLRNATPNYAFFQSLTFDRLPGKKDDSVSVEKRELVKLIRNESKANLQKIRDSYFWISPEQCLADIQASAPAVEMMIDLTIQFMEKLAAAKRDKNMIDFGDMEHFALKILLEDVEETEQNGAIRTDSSENQNADVFSRKGIRPTKTAREYQAYFEEILIDEYQDSNLVQEYLLQSISRESQGVYNRFMVGDVKQSIYKFRLARPEIFMEKYYRYPSIHGVNIQGVEEDKHQGLNQEAEKAVRIDLKQNFRSRKEVIESVNYIFYQIMMETIGGVIYDKDAALYLGAEYEDLREKTQESTVYDSKFWNNDTEVILIEKDQKEETIDPKELEAMAIARKIKSFVGHFPVTDKESGALRPATYKDIVILLRSNAGWDDVFKRTLMEQGIPSYTASKTGYFTSIEIQTVLNFIRILDNPLQDIPLCAVLRSEVFQFTEEEFAKIRVLYRKGLFYDGLLQYREEGTESPLVEKIQDFLEVLEKYRERIPYTPIHELLHQFMEEVGFYYYMSALPGGEQRKANLDQLLEKAIQFEATSYHGLFHFIRYIEQMQKYDVDMGEANIQDENADVVRIMSIHKSKGLEFPICFVSGLSKRFNMQDARKSLVMDLDYGIGTDYINPEQRYKTPTLRKNAIARKLQQDNIGEELRVLYVALTRAKEKLILTGTVDDLQKKITSVSQLLKRGECTLPYSSILGMNSYMDLLLSALIRHRSCAPLLESCELQPNTRNNLYEKGPDMQITVWNQETMVQGKVAESIGKELLKQKLLHAGQKEASVQKLLQKINEKFSYEYPHKILAHLYTKTTVSELKKMGQSEPSVQQEYGKLLYEEPEVVPYIPKFMQEKEEISGTTRGSAYHRVLELLDIVHVSNEAEIRSQMEGLVQEGRLSQEYADAVRLEKIQQFLQSDMAARMKEACEKNLLYREQPFVLGVPANEIETEFPAEEMILVQGIIDVYFVEDGKLVVADYKTDKVEHGEELWNRYRKQLDYYAKALSRLLDMPVKEKIIYSFALGCEV
ncbi:MAG: helicase-exonuclease AddAB subunit AddA [Lachnospiraceae bacterium]|nr:helicase-exonuclease AddAB subunit AddA [Lachnospiraceae bacterium]